ncbi:MAG: hypothetical protein JWM32_1681 [Verrucomicrobia bacterium]|nr:hypothetical protein [Verrucomicrobiota bacterium]
MPSPLVIDPEAIENLRALDESGNDEFLREILGIFLEDVPHRIAELDEAIASGDVGRFTRAAHSIKGASSNVGANALRAVAEQLESRSHAEPLTSLASTLAALKTDFATTKVEIEKLLAK